MNDYKMNFHEIRMTMGICIILILRMLGMFMVAPAINTTGMFMGDTNRILIGFAIGIYGLMQAIFQIPFGFISNKIGYKKTIIFGLFIFFFGSLISAFSQTIWGFILGRGLQGCSAISSLCLAFLSNCVREQNYTKSISFVGISFGFSFLISIIFGPMIISLLGLNGLFKMVSILSFLCILIALYYVFPYYTPLIFSNKTITLKKFFYLFSCYDIVGYCLSIFFLHLLLALNFIIIPKNIELLGYVFSDHWKIYLIIILFSLIISTPIILFSEIKRYIRFAMITSIIIFIISEFFFFISYQNHLIFFLGMQLFFSSFILSESFLPSLLNKISPLQYKSMIMGIYSTSQFLGIASGGILGGIIYYFYNIQLICVLAILLSIVWLLIFYFISPPIYIISFSIKIQKKNIDDINFKKLLNSFPGIIFFQYSNKSNILYLKINSKITNKKKVKMMIKNYFSDI